MKKKVLSMLLVVAMGVSMLAAGCSSKKEETGGDKKEAKSGDKKEIAVLISDMTATYASWLAQSFEELGEKYPRCV